MRIERISCISGCISGIVCCKIPLVLFWGSGFFTMAVLGATGSISPAACYACMAIGFPGLALSVGLLLIDKVVLLCDAFKSLVSSNRQPSMSAQKRSVREYHFDLPKLEEKEDYLPRVQALQERYQIVELNEENKEESIVFPNEVWEMIIERIDDLKTWALFSQVSKRCHTLIYANPQGFFTKKITNLAREREAWPLPRGIKKIFPCPELIPTVAYDSRYDDKEDEPVVKADNGRSMVILMKIEQTTPYTPPNKKHVTFETTQDGKWSVDFYYPEEPHQIEKHESLWCRAILQGHVCKAPHCYDKNDTTVKEREAWDHKLWGSA